VRTIIALAVASLWLVAFHAHPAPLPGKGTWAYTLLPRDLTNDGVPDAYYDTVLKVTWLRNWNSITVDSWSEAKAWASALSVGQHSDWRLPTLVDTGSPGCTWSLGGTDCGYSPQTIDVSSGLVYNEMAHLWFVTLGNLSPYYSGTGTAQAGWGLTNTADFLNLIDTVERRYWQDITVAVPWGVPTQAWLFDVHNGYQTTWTLNAGWLVVAVHPGDVGTPVAAPPPYALIPAALLAVTAMARRRKRQDITP